MRGDAGTSNRSDASAASLKWDAYDPHDNQCRGETMTTQAIQNARCGSSERAETIGDILLIASFGLWAVLLGALPVLAFQLLIRS
jgi:hypothetical protein